MKHKHTHEEKEQPVFYDKSFSNENERQYELDIKLIQPWSVPIMRIPLPPHVLQTMIEISDLVIADKEAKSWGQE